MSSKKKITVNQHIVPQAYLKRFATLTENKTIKLELVFAKKTAMDFLQSHNQLKMLAT